MKFESRFSGTICVVARPRTNGLNYVKVTVLLFFRMLFLSAICTSWHAVNTGGSRLLRVSE